MEYGPALMKDLENYELRARIMWAATNALNNTTMIEPIEHAADILSKAKSAVALTGAGISVESGIPPFRGKGGLWEKIDPMKVAHIDAQCVAIFRLQHLHGISRVALFHLHADI